MSKVPGLDADVHFGDAQRPLPDWRQEEPSEEEERTSVIAMLGFDPAELWADERSVGESLLEGWITLTSKGAEGDKHGTTHVYIDYNGNISTGPAHMIGKKVGELKGHKVTAVHGETHPDEKKSGKI